jgi:hypothetical protein
MVAFVVPIIVGVARIATAARLAKTAQNSYKIASKLKVAKGVKASTKAAKPGPLGKTSTGYAIGSTIRKVTTKQALKKTAGLAITGTTIFSTVSVLKEINKKDVKSTNKDDRPVGENKSGPAVEGDTTPSPTPEADPNDYSWNLPPHTWSLPKLPASVNNLGGGYQDFGKPQSSSDTYRRGRLWWRQSADVALQTGSTQKDKKEYNVESIASGDHERRYGFQFMWNPDSIQTQVAVQMDAVPNVNDMFLSLVAAFPATQSIAFNIRLDRTNDFACAQARFERPGLSSTLPNTTNRPDAAYDAELFAKQQLRKETVRDFGQYYLPAGAFQQSSAQFEEKLMDLFTRGTLADIEFLYKTINGDGAGSMKWTNRRGIQTADIGYLMPTLLNIDIGPLAYQGYVNSLSITHTSFTPDMVPIRSDLSISLQVLATSGLALKSAVK